MNRLIIFILTILLTISYAKCQVNNPGNDTPGYKTEINMLYRDKTKGNLTDFWSHGAGWMFTILLTRKIFLPTSGSMEEDN